MFNEFLDDGLSKHINKTWCNLQTYLDLYSLTIFSKFKENYSVGCPKGGGGESFLEWPSILVHL